MDDVTQLLALHTAGDKSALDRLLPLVYEELRRLARAYLSRERDGHTLQPTALVHEAYMRLIGQQTVDWSNRAQFLGVAASMMRRVLVNYAEARNAARRDSSGVLPDPGAAAVSDRQMVDILTLDQALSRLKDVDPRQMQIVELRYFAGLSIEETAEALNLSVATVKREWAVARLWVRRELAGSPAG
ncbi:ECF-type sigma factor [Paludibaculum fermentans]|uniref:Sigma-70 family RNA polymerase sigma factor n=1 Tax=Paludibaculum fermentans TaxID=1473598 RepID=A0A7S7SJR8_PALFE|nr:ECF-type sigma factor [Paludibaculum fermentans]QOY87008.1 sigma-70 family RNA polymerase sigma factor [Paludibaculum fermentans]